MRTREALIAEGASHRASIERAPYRSAENDSRRMKGSRYHVRCAVGLGDRAIRVFDKVLVQQRLKIQGARD
jgi:hypothetical protein